MSNNQSSTLPSEEEMTDEQDNFLRELNNISSVYETETFDPTIPTVGSIGQLILANELKYVQHILDADEENKLIEDNAKDIMELPKALRARATQIALDIENTQDPEYFSKHSVDDKFIKPVQQIRVMINKKEEAKIKSWKAEYRARLVCKLRVIKGKVELAQPIEAPEKSFFARLFNK